MKVKIKKARRPRDRHQLLSSTHEVALRDGIDGSASDVGSFRFAGVAGPVDRIGGGEEVQRLLDGLDNGSMARKKSERHNNENKDNNMNEKCKITRNESVLDDWERDF